MNAHSPRIHTQGESDLFAAFDSATFNDAVPHQTRKAALDAIREKGLPTKRVEAYHYTDLRALLAAPAAPVQRPDEAAAEAAGKPFAPLVDDAAVLHFRDGHLFQMGRQLPDGVALAENTAPVAQPDPAVENAIELLNTAFLTSACELAVDAGTTIEQTIGLACAPTTASLGATRVAVKVGANASCRLTERSVGADGLNYCTSSIVDLHIADGATVDYTLSIEDGDAAQRLARLSATLGAGSTLNLVVLNAGGKVVRQELYFDVQGENANLNISGVNLIGGDAHIDVTSRIDHAVPNTNSTELFRNVATESGRGVFQGQIRVAQPAQLTDARMACNTLLLSDSCDFSAKPELEIFADDVQCAHGATVADIEDDYMFYLQARGISEAAARRMLVKAFVQEVLDELDNETLAERLSARIDTWMEAHI